MSVQLFSLPVTEHVVVPGSRARTAFVVVANRNYLCGHPYDYMHPQAGYYLHYMMLCTTSIC